MIGSNVPSNSSGSKIASKSQPSSIKVKENKITKDPKKSISKIGSIMSKKQDAKHSAADSLIKLLENKKLLEKKPDKEVNIIRFSFILFE